MSTKFTSGATHDGQISLDLMALRDRMLGHLMMQMHANGHAELTVSHLTFFANLNCGVTSASEAARRMGVTRQAVYRTTRSLQDIGALELEIDGEKRNQKQIRMTEYGEKIALDAREILAATDALVLDRIGADGVNALREVLISPLPQTL